MPSRIKKFWKSLGPGLITGASDDDPSGIVTYSVAGARLGPAAVWTMLYILPLMIAVQKMSAKIGISSACGLAGNIKRYYSKWLLVFISALIIISNTFNIGANVFGMASAIEILTPGSTIFLSWLIIGLILILTVVLPYRKIVTIFKWLAFSLFAYVIAGVLVINDWPGMIYHLAIPSISWDKSSLMILVAIFGTTISPYMAFWQASEEAEEKKISAGGGYSPVPSGGAGPASGRGPSREGKREKEAACEYRIVTKHELKRVTADTSVGMFFSNFIGFFIIALTGTVLFSAGIRDINTIKEAAEALRPLAGNYAYILFTLGVISAGILAIPILAGSSAYVLSEIFSWGGSLDKPFSKAKEFYLVIIFSAIVGMFIPYFGINPVKALLWTSIIHGLVAPFLIAILIHMSNNPAIVGPNTNNKKENSMAYFTLFLMSLAVITFLFIETPVEEIRSFIYELI
ncbi:MAG: divalent metal cation transporter [Candidatus Yanofskybacteria bacterium]|nr:divalent metal cation transporter [Candidatus Yanofskybacteria bacterium]